MPNCKNDPTRKYKGTEPSPIGLGYCVEVEKSGTIKKGKDGDKWIVYSLIKNNKAIKKWKKLDKYIIITINYTVINKLDDKYITNLPDSWIYIGKDKYNVINKKYTNNKYFTGKKKYIKKAENNIKKIFDKYKKNKCISKYSITKKENIYILREPLKNKKLIKIYTKEQEYQEKLYKQLRKNNNKKEKNIEKNYTDKNVEFNFKITDEIKQDIYMIQMPDTIKFYSKFLKIKLSEKFPKKEFNLLLKSLELKKNQDKIIKKIQNIPEKELKEIYKFYKKNTNDKKIIKEAIIIKIKLIYNKYSLLNIFINNVIHKNNWGHFGLIWKYNNLDNIIKILKNKIK